MRWVYDAVRWFAETEALERTLGELVQRERLGDLVRVELLSSARTKRR